MSVSAGFDAERLAQHPLEWGGVTGGRPDFQFGVARRPDLEQRIVGAIVQLDAGDGLCVTAVQALCEAEHRGERPHDVTLAPREAAEAVMLAFRRRAAVVAGDERHRLHFHRFESAEVAVADQVVRVLVVVLVADVDADVMEQGGVLEPLPLAVRESVDAPGLVEQPAGDPRDLMRVVAPVVAPLGQFNHAAAPYVRVTVGLGNLFAVPRDVVEHESFAQGEIAERQLRRLESPGDRVEQNGPRDGQVGPARLEPLHPETALEAEARHGLAGAA